MKRDAETTWAAERVENALLRERINDVAAEVARLTAVLEGPGSPIETMLADEGPDAVKPGRRGCRLQRHNGEGAATAGTRPTRARARSPTASALCSRPPRAWRRTSVRLKPLFRGAYRRAGEPRKDCPSLDTPRSRSLNPAPIGPGA